MALSVESCVGSRVCGGLVRAGGDVTTSAGSVGESNEVVAVVVGVVDVTVVTEEVQFGSVLSLLLMEAGGL